MIIIGFNHHPLTVIITKDIKMAERELGFYLHCTNHAKLHEVLPADR